SNLMSYKLQSTSPMINAGLNLASLFGVSTGGKDFWGNATPVGGAYDIGAFDTNATTPPPPPPFSPVHVNFQPAASPPFSGYAVDSGAVYGSRSNGLTYGWNADDSANTRDRDSSLSLDQRYDTLIHMQK